MKRSGLAVLAFLCLCAPAGASEGNLTQIAGVDGPLLDGASEVVVSPDGKHVYALGYESDALVAFSRDAATGALTQIDCASETGNGGACEDAIGIDYPDGLAISPDGEFIYAGGQTSDAVAVFARDATDGTITEVSCLSATGDGMCDAATNLDGAVGIAVSGDGEHVYVAAYLSDAITAYDRDPTTGALTAIGCVSETGAGGCANGRGLNGPYPGVAVTADGTSVYVPSHDSDAIAILDRDPATGALSQPADTTGCISETGSGGECADGATLDNANFVVTDPGSDHVYVASSISGAINVYDRAAGGNLTFDSCVSEDGSGGACADGRGLAGTLGLGMSADGASLYALAGGGNAIAVFDRGTDGSIVQKPGTAGCIADGGGIECATGNQMVTPRGAVAVTPDGKHVYASASLSDAVAAFARTPNGRPFCAPVNAGSFKHDSVLEFTLGCTDPDGDPFTIQTATSPAHGTLGTIDANGKVTLTPVKGYVGTDSFTYRAADAGGAGDAAPVTWTFTNQAPACTDGAASVAAGGTVTVPVSCSDGDGDALTLAVASAPSGGTLSTPNPVTRTVDYTAPAGGGTFTFAISATDATGASATQTVTVTVAAPPAPSPTPTPTPTPTPSAPVVVPVTQVATLPSPRRCVSRRRFRIRLKGVKGNRIVRAEIKLNGKVTRRVSGRALSLPIDLRGLPKGRWKVEITTTDSAGKRVVGRRTYRTCVPRRRT